MTDRTDPPPPLTADDPRISEWLDGRLPAAEAAVIERAVQASPTLVALVADLRALKAAARAIPPIAPPADFASRVLAAIVTEGGRPDADRAVDDEWQAIEAARIAEERAEAAADIEGAAHEPASGRRWPWLALAGALAAGLLVTLVLNRPWDEAREVALAERETSASRETTGPAVMDEDRLAAGLSRGLSSVPAAATPPAQLAGAPEPRQAAAATARNRANAVLEGAEAERAARDQPAPMAAADAVRLEPEEPAPIEVIVWGAEGRAALARRIEALGLVATPTRPFGGGPARDKAGSPADLLELVGSREAIATLLAEVAGWEQSDRRAEKQGLEKKRLDGEAGENPDDDLRDQTRVVIRVVDEEGPPTPVEP